MGKKIYEFIYVDMQCMCIQTNLFSCRKSMEDDIAETHLEYSEHFEEIECKEVFSNEYRHTWQWICKGDGKVMKTILCEAKETCVLDEEN